MLVKSKHLNKPNISYNKEVPFTKPTCIGLQLDMNLILIHLKEVSPRYSYLYTYLNIVKYGEEYIWIE